MISLHRSEFGGGGLRRQASENERNDLTTRESYPRKLPEKVTRESRLRVSCFVSCVKEVEEENLFSKVDEKTIIVQVVCTKRGKRRRSHIKKEKHKKERSKSEYSLFHSRGESNRKPWTNITSSYGEEKREESGRRAFILGSMYSEC